jgi:succinate-semialdehyde dehydrogenase / glutarate-semialdehyde dehydrogenase
MQLRNPAFPLDRHDDHLLKSMHDEVRTADPAIDRAQVLGNLLGLAAAADGASLDLVSPITGARFANIRTSSDSDVRSAFLVAREAQRQWMRLAVTDRVHCARRLAHVVDARRNLIMDVIQLETGKTRRDALEEVLDVIVTSSYYASIADSALAPRRHRGAMPGITRATSHRQPFGVVGMICPWNYPFTLFPSDAVPALLAGNAVVAKPSELTPLTALVGRLMLLEAGFPVDLVQVVIGEREVGQAVIDHADYVQFTGSTGTGRSVAERAGMRLIPCTLELGGKNPMFVRGDADIETAVSGAVKGCFANAGQLCVSFERVFVHAGIYPEFRRAFVARTKRLKAGHSKSFDDEYGSLISARHMEKIREHVDQAVALGATIATGGEPMSGVGPYFYAPTILEDVPASARIATEETFGPVVSLAPFESDDDIIRHANELPVGLHASVWTRDIELGQKLASQMNFGTVAINDAYVGMWGSTDLPMGGSGESGLGRRHGEEGLLKYTETRGIVVQKGHPIAPPHGVPGNLLAQALSRVATLRRTLGI